MYVNVSLVTLLYVYDKQKLCNNKLCKGGEEWHSLQRNYAYTLAPLLVLRNK